MKEQTTETLANEESKRGRGRPKGSGRGLTDSQRAKESRKKRQTHGARIDFVLSYNGQSDMEGLRKYDEYKNLNTKELIEKLLADTLQARLYANK